ncbi:cyclophilin-like domain-containing protein [Mycena albidolilacea]|uniref:peptidylprolyl isomerase n=1 Tax=Mycena albidolilacea TaxID=1033008 RepID=A0AAD6Z8W7_9AGAR|nr:cyclophilin-like domain-containing protein [Mycena albidolilacea]
MSRLWNGSLLGLCRHTIIRLIHVSPAVHGDARAEVADDAPAEDGLDEDDADVVILDEELNPIFDTSGNCRAGINCDCTFTSSASAAAAAAVSGPKSNVFFDIHISAKPSACILFMLFDNDVPRMAAKFRELATGQHGFGMANAGRNTNGSQFFITTVATPNVGEGLEVVKAIEARGSGSGAPSAEVMIAESEVVEGTNTWIYLVSLTLSTP